MRIILENKGSVNCPLRHARDNKYKRCIINPKTSFNLCTVIDGTDGDKTILLDMVKRHSMNVYLEFSDEKNLLDRWLNLTLKSGFFSEFQEIFRRNFTIIGELQFLPQPVIGARGIAIVFKKGLKSPDDTNKYSFRNNKVSYGVNFSDHFMDIVNTLQPWTVAKLILHIETHEATDCPIVDFRFQINRTILYDEIATDVTIIACNNAQIKCHKCFLIAHSWMLKGMLNSGMQGTTTDVIVMKNFSERAVRALLAYLYYWDLTEASSNCDLAVELYKAADYYIIPRLDADLRHLFLKKPAEWFSVDGALNLFVLARRLGRAQLKSVAQNALQMKLDWN